MGNLRQNIRQDRFTGPMYRRLWAPAMVSSLGWALSDMADAVVVGQSWARWGWRPLVSFCPCIW